MVRRHAWIALCGVLAGILLVPGCILIRTTEHRISINDDGTGEAVLRLIDLRSDETADSLVQRDFHIMLSSYEREGAEKFERDGRKITGKKLYTRGDTLYAEVAYTFESIIAIEGLHVTDDELYVVVPDTREVIRTNGKMAPWLDNSRRIVWSRETRRIMFQIREKTVPPSTSLARFYHEIE
jgi:hypothetical protein